MPFYEFYNAETDTRLMVPRRVDDRDKPLEFHRITVPSTIGIHGFEPSDAEAFDDTILKKFHRKEEQLGSRFQCGEYTKQQIKDAWTNPIRDNGHG